MIRIGVICPSEIAFRRFMPAIKKAGDMIQFGGIAYARPEEWSGDLCKLDSHLINEHQKREQSKAQAFIDAYGGKIFDGYENLILSDEVDAIYLPLPPALHYKWSKLALEKGKHVFVEKPSTCYFDDTKSLVEIARSQELALHENYMFVFHNQIKEIKEIIKSGEKLGIPYLFRMTFGFPRRDMNDFRYNKTLGGGALLDAGGYTIRYATELLGNTARMTTAQANFIPDFEVDIFGTATIVNDKGQTAQLAFGMDNDYRCDIEVWGSKGTITSCRIFTAPQDYVPTYTLKKNQELSKYELPQDDAFYKSVIRFLDCIYNDERRKENYNIILKQEQLIQQFRDLCDL